MNEPTQDERLIKAWRDIVHATVTVVKIGANGAETVPDPRPVDVTRTVLAPLLALAERALDIDRMHARVAMIVRVIGDQAHCAIAYGHEDAWPEGHEWAVQISHYEEYGGYKEAVSFNDERVTSYAATTLHEAVRLAWEHHGSPVECAACHGRGEFSHHFAAEIGAVAHRLGEFAEWTDHHDGSRTGRTTCTACRGEGMFVTEVAT